MNTKENPSKGKEGCSISEAQDSSSLELGASDGFYTFFAVASLSWSSMTRKRNTSYTEKLVGGSLSISPPVALSLSIVCSIWFCFL